MSSEDDTWMSATVIGIGLIVFGAMIFAISAGLVASGALHSNHQLEEAIHVGGIVAAALAILYGVVGVLVGIVNQSTAGEYEDHGDEDHGDEDHAHHGSWSPVIIAFGVMLFLMGFIKANLSGEFGILAVGVVIVLAGIANWWREDFGNDGVDEPVSTGEPFGGLEVRKVGMWVFLMSEIMIFGSFFSSYLRLRMGWLTHWDATCDPYNGVNAHAAGGHETLVHCNSPEMVSQGYMVVASEFIGESFWTLLPGAINTFALILSSFTVVLALKNAGMVDWQAPKNKFVRMWMPDQRRAVRNNLAATLFLGSMFLVLKIVEWNHLITGAPNFNLGNPDVALSASVFYVTTGAHGFHVFVGLLFLLFFTFKAQKGGWTPENKQSIEYFGIYWHFVDLAWVAIFPAFYLY
ncbi:MAG: hypothetical protein CXT69_01700 [Methanobacteriota archaeon]|jgi:cytochrome c oxidase subunit I+III|nr:MAG: hypothetical protein CXT69_01700 [Euryarchaeota archaeon]HIK78998.1 hypothetical protein [Candidatus Poseidoniales archaeon]